MLFYAPELEVVSLRAILDASSQRIIRILEVLSAHEEWMTFADLSSIIKTSGRTIAEDISKIRKRWGQNLNIEVSKKMVYGFKIKTLPVSALSLPIFLMTRWRCFGSKSCYSTPTTQ
jgi:hypothetical protein